MDNPLPDLLEPWLTRFGAIDWANSRSHGLASIRDFQHVGLHSKLLRVALSFWDPVMHVFDLATTSYV
ncbi:hypothetical protein RHMOL_Rhmol08G0164300 [Rhododendron molle]|uniref:Uncharacterized protein n=1 Tax=Rhododendron molle TaxID=49168 RepID=A0ACC0MNX6_RHOML|nr:hypothetical protein RHMOL_Rhmol08G0164300 [Rhododendron molle]